MNDRDVIPRDARVPGPTGSAGGCGFLVAGQTELLGMTGGGCGFLVAGQTELLGMTGC